LAENGDEGLTSMTGSGRLDDEAATPRVLVVDDHPLVSSGVSEAVKRQGGTAIVAHDLSSAATILAEDAIDVLLLDINFPEGPGTTLLKDDRTAARVPARCFLLSGAMDPDDIMLAFDDGALGFISKAVPFEDLESALGQIIRDDVAHGDAMMWHTDAGRFRPVREVFSDRALLSPREREIFRLLRDGLQDKEIAYRTDRSIHTVRVQIRSIRRKRGLNRRAEVDHARSSS
jgi:DNA-binding NarL/FixJ family response regulator